MRSIPRILQTAYGCGPAAMSMILQSYGEDVTDRDIISAVGGIGQIDSAGNIGTMVTDNALFARRLGYPVTCYTYNMRLLSPEEASLDQVDLYWFLESIRQGTSGMDSRVLSSYLSLLEEGADLIVQQPRLETLHGHLESDIPLMVNLDQMLFHAGHRFTGIGHSIVASGSSPSRINYIDPDDAGLHSASRALMLSAMDYYSKDHSSYLIVVEPKLMWADCAPSP